ncbi:MAG TPA: futalosine hydrolase [Sphingobacteriaceae bacterium]
MKILVVAATQGEIAPLLDQPGRGSDLRFLITGVGMVATAFALGTHLAGNKYDLAINAGIAGSFDRNLKIGEVLSVSEDLFAELGAEDHNDFLPIDKLGFGESLMRPVAPGFDIHLKQAKAITVSRVHGNETTIYNTMSRLHPQLESMEGAAFFYSCNQVNLPSIQIRAVSNYVERRNLSNWNVQLAVENLNTTIISLLERL